MHVAIHRFDLDKCEQLSVHREPIISEKRKHPLFFSFLMGYMVEFRSDIAMFLFLLYVDILMKWSLQHTISPGEGWFNNFSVKVVIILSCLVMLCNTYQACESCISRYLIDLIGSKFSVIFTSEQIKMVFR